MERKTNEL